MPTLRRAPACSRILVLVVGAVMAFFVIGCSSPGTAPPTTPAVTKAPAVAVPATARPPAPVATPGSTSRPTHPASQEPASASQGTTSTEWGTILDAVPPAFPVYPGARPADGVGLAVSGSWVVEATVDAVAAWYRDALEKAGFATTGLSSPLEDGSRVLDTVSDVPECRIQTTFRPAGGSTMIVVLYGAGCAAAGG